MSELGECRECVTRKKDHSEKELHKCSYCGESFCAEHMDAKHVHIPSLKATHKHARLVSAMKRDWERDGGHPCFQYSYTYSDQARAWEIKRALDRMTETTPWCKKRKREWKVETGYETPSEFLYPPYSRKHKSKIGKVRKIVVGLLKVLAFSIFTIATMLPTILYLFMMTLPKYQSTLAVLYVFRPDFLLWGIIIPNLGYLIAWVVVVYKVLRKRGKWWYYLILLGFGLWNWWNLPRAIWWFEFFRGIFGG